LINIVLTESELLLVKLIAILHTFVFYIFNFGLTMSLHHRLCVSFCTRLCNQNYTIN